MRSGVYCIEKVWDYSITRSVSGMFMRIMRRTLRSGVSATR
jgi:hypothetical protein